MTDQSGGDQSGGQAPGGGQQQSGAAPAGNSQPLEQLDRQAQHQQQRPPENPNSKGYSPARDARIAAAARQHGAELPVDQQQPGAQPPAGGEKIKIGDVEISPDEFKKVMQFKGEQDARKLTLPTSAEEYKLEVPADFKPPGDVKFEFNKDDPVLANARKLALARGMDQGTFSDFLGVYAAERISEAVKINTARNAEIAKLGTMAPQRIDAIRTWARGMVGDQLGGALEQMLVTSRHVEAFEKIIDKFSRQGGTQFSQAHREGEPPKGTIPGYANMSFEQKRAAQMSQNTQPQRTTRDIR
jgi:hypothetical protein